MNTRKRVVKITIALLIAWLGIFATDYIRCGSLKEPIFVIPSDNVADDGGSGIYYGFGYTINMEKRTTAQYGVQLISVEMMMFNKVISASIQ